VLKLKRILNSCHKLLNEDKNAIIFLQETHLDNTDYKTIEMMWRHNFLISPGTNRQCGCLVLFDHTWQLEFQINDENGRYNIGVLAKFEKTFIIVNVYAPNDHNINFFANIFEKIIEIQSHHPGAEIILGGDFNLVLGDSDSANRNATLAERQTRTLIKRNLGRLMLNDSYRLRYPSGGFTWVRGNCMSRLDMIFVTDYLKEHLNTSVIDWSFDDSDHAMLKSVFELTVAFPRGPGLLRLNADVLDDANMLDFVRSELKFQLEQIPEGWDPHTKLNFVKSAIRSIISAANGRKRKIENLEEETIAEQLNTLFSVKEKLEQGIIVHPTLLADVNHTIKSLEAERNRFLDERAKKLAIRAQTKWYEEGERSNKYFFNIIKKRSEQKLITKLTTTDNEELVTQEKIMSHVTDFYAKLYDNKETETNYNDLLSDLPSLKDEDNRILDGEITLEELRSVLNDCNDTAPGPDGIPYKIYRKLWNELGSFLLDSWKYSISIGILPLDQRISTITLLPKQGKALEKIENWRPITLTNCDLKLFTKLMANRVSTVLHKVIHPSQTAYIPGRVVHDNLRMFDFYNKYCRENNVDALIISLDAKKAFDSVSHKYMYKVLKSYGFSDNFIDTVKLLYNDIKASIMVNGYKSTLIKILRSVKQGDALSCALFILCIDPLIRKIENNRDIKPIPIPRSAITNIKIQNKVGGFADDIGIAIKNDRGSIAEVFQNYSTFSRLSGIELNIEKTEILKLNVNSLHQEFNPIDIEIEGRVIKTCESLTICGICFSNNANIEYELNILDKITRMEKQLIIWLQRPLSIEGKILIIKTFGLSQLIYSLQMCEIRESEITDIERMIFKFIWNKKWIGTSAPDRIKRSTLKLPYEKGGLQVPDIDSLNKALKVKQFIRAMKTQHPINLIQKFLLEKIGYDDYFKIEYAKISKICPVTKTFQLTCNKLTDRFRDNCNSLPLPNPETLGESASVIASTDVLEYLMRKKELFLINRFGYLINLGISSYKELLNESLYPSCDYSENLSKYILSHFPCAWKEVVINAEQVDPEIDYEETFPFQNFQLINTNTLTVKMLRKTLLEVISEPTHPYKDSNKFQLVNINNTNPFLLIRKFLHSPRDRFFKYRILQGDIFCNERMFKFKMVNSPTCTFCSNLNQTESIKHLIWDCPRSQRLWSFLDSVIYQAFNVRYINYEAIIVGSENVIPVVEPLIVTTLKLIFSKDRSNIITVEELKSKLRIHFIIERNMFSNKNKLNKFWARWAKLKPVLFNDV